jgi:signal recognition particle receptor subunit beta
MIYGMYLKGFLRSTSQGQRLYSSSIALTDPEAYAQNKYRLQELRYLHQKNPFVYVVAFSRQDMSEARTPEEMRDILSIPDDVKVMGYSVKESVTTKQVVLALIELFPRNEVVTQMIDALKARINDS